MIKNKDIHIRLSEQESDTLNARARQANMTLCEYLRQAGMKGNVQARRSPEEIKALGVLLRELHPLGSNLNQIAAKLNSTAVLSPEGVDELRTWINYNITLCRELKDLLK